MTIRRLDPGTAAQIAAGEVVERPASVVKEMVENSIDAGASQITIDIQGDSPESIRITDNGCGIPADQLYLAFQRYCTSKLQKPEDLQSITTLGFRGEALPSIASVSLLTCHSRTPDASAGTRVSLRYGEPENPPQPFGCPVGTTFQVSDLFGNAPVRRKFLRTRNTELNHIHQAITRYAMSQPGVKFSLTSDRRKSLETPGNNSLLDTILAIYDDDTARDMLELSLQGEEISISGYTSTNDTVRSSRAEITTLVNGRWIRDSDLAYAVEQGYNKSLPPHRHPISIVNISIPTHLVDVNCHPAKQEVRFRNASKVFGAVRTAVEQALRQQSPMHRFNRPLHPRSQPTPTHPEDKDHPFREAPSPTRSSNNGGWSLPAPEVNPAYEPNTLDSAHMHSQPSSAQTGQDQQRTSATRRSSARPTEPDPRERPIWHGIPSEQLHENLAPSQPLRLTFPDLRVLGQSAATYIVAEHPQGLVLMDQHAAHERVLYDRIRAAAQSRSTESQGILAPVTTALSPQQSDMVQEHHELLTRYGFNLTENEDAQWIIAAVPATMITQANASPEDMLADLLEELAFESISTETEIALAATIACHSAVRAGDALTITEMESIVQQLSNTPEPNTCPHGRPTTLQLRKSHIEMEFRRRR